MTSAILTFFVSVFALLASVSMFGNIDETTGGFKNPASPVVALLVIIGFGGLLITLFCLIILPQPREKEKDEFDISL